MTASSAGGLPSGDSLADGLLKDVVAPRRVLSQTLRFTGRVWDVVTDEVDLGAGGVVHRDYVRHTGAVAIIALNERGEVYLVHQYRHPVGRVLWEPPAGLLDMEGEPPLEAAKRELWEEADLRAATWHTLADFFTTPGGVSERIRVFLARDLTEVPEGERFAREAEELDMEGRWVPLTELLEAIQAGRVGGPTTSLGAFALDAAIRADFATLRPADEPFSL